MKITIHDSHDMKDHLGNVINESLGGIKKTKLKVIDRSTGEVIREGHNKVLVPGSQITACKQFGLEQAVAFPTYNSLLGLDNSHKDWEIQPANDPITCLWAVGRDGFDTSPNEVNIVTNTDRIEPVDDIVPFRYVPKNSSLSVEMRDIYFGKRTMGDYEGYYFKKFDTQPQLHVRYIDGTEVTNKMYSVNTDQAVEVYVEFRLSVTRMDFREYFNRVLGWDKATISTLSLMTAWYDNITWLEHPIEDPTKDIYYRYYQDIIPFTKWNFREIDLTDLTSGVDFIYQVYY